VSNRFQFLPDSFSALSESVAVAIDILFQESREVILDVYNTINAVKPTVPELGMLILAGAVYTTHFKRGRSLTMHPYGEQSFPSHEHKPFSPRHLSFRPLRDTRSEE
jgi:hypothetical protein